ncbi:MAG: hypothetical protein JRG80_12770 [Deltaproteobacteria bacterium]|nr:hypothetical protein [Deltaproteobacteria bacterium]MBW2400129.1 hypothetical protein [Deltaproteobacteria bacterium]
MVDAPAFDWMCTRLEQDTSLDRLAARGTVRLALKGAGLDARTLTPDQLKVVIDKLLVGELTARGIDDAAGLCSSLLAALASAAQGLTTEAAGEAPDAVFSRLARVA